MQMKLLAEIQRRMIKIKTNIANPSVQTLARLQTTIRRMDTQALARLITHVRASVETQAWHIMTNIKADLKEHWTLRVLTRPVQLPKMIVFFRAHLYWKFMDTRYAVRAAIVKTVNTINTYAAICKTAIEKSAYASVCKAILTKGKAVVAKIPHETKQESSLAVSTSNVTIKEASLFASVNRTRVTKHIFLQHMETKSVDHNALRVTVTRLWHEQFDVQAMPISAQDTRTVRTGPVAPTLGTKTIFLAFTPKEVATLRIIQWFLHHTNVNNEGFSNEIVYDLASVPPVGSMPPPAGEKWGGGYVDHPFLGMGFGATGDSTGYLSPEAKKWLQNAKMFWETPTEVFDDE
jgi:hypothetical protein